jgi:uncharacterized protein (TIGR02118 family)
MIVVSVMCPKTNQSTFDFNYYVQKHIPMAKARFEEFGSLDVRVMRGSAMMDGAGPMYALIAEVTFPSQEHLQDALAKYGAEIMADIPNYTNVQPVIQINESL